MPFLNTFSQRTIGGGMGTDTRASLLIRVKDPRDNEAWDQFFHIYAPLIERWCAKAGLCIADAEDVTQKVLVAVVGAMRTFDYQRDKGKFRSWLFTAVRREIGRFVDRDRKLGERIQGEAKDALLENEPTDASEGGIWMEEYTAHIYATALQHVRREFDSDTWVAFHRHWIDGVVPKDVAAEVGKTVSWVYKAKHKVVQRLKEEVTFLADDLHLFDQ